VVVEQPATTHAHVATASASFRIPTIQH
jgi:hypothetical protein